MTCKNRMKGVLLFLFLIWGVVEQVYPQQALQSPDGKVWTRGMEVLKVERAALRFVPVK